MMKLLLSTLVIFLLNIFSPFAFNLWSYSTDPPSGSVLVNGEDITVDFTVIKQYNDDVNVYVRPFSDGALASNYGASGGVLVSGNSGSGTASFTIQAGVEEIDQIRFQAVDASTGDVVGNDFVDVDFEFVPHQITNISFDKPDGSTLVHDERVNVTFDYASSYGGEIRLYVTPLTNGSRSPYAGTNPSGLYSTPRGSGSGFFDINLGDVTVDQVRIRMTEENSSNVLYDRIIQNSYEYTSFYVKNLTYSPTPGSILQIDEFVDIDFGYKTSESDDFKIRAIPLNGGSEPGNYDSSASAVYSSSDGDGSVQFTVGSGNTEIDQIRFELVSVNEAFVRGTHTVDVQFSTETVTRLNSDVNDSSGITVFPVPVRGNEFLLKSTAEMGHYYLIGMDSKILSQGSFNVGENPVRVDDFPSGIYILRIVTEEGEEIKKVVVQ